MPNKHKGNIVLNCNHVLLGFINFHHFFVTIVSQFCAAKQYRRSGEGLNKSGINTTLLLLAPHGTHHQKFRNNRHKHTFVRIRHYQETREFLNP